MTKFENMRFFINNDKELSEKIQKRLFELGYVWRGGKKEFLHPNAILYLYTHEDGRVSYSVTSCSRENYPLKTYEDIMSEEKEEYMIKKQKLFVCKTCGNRGCFDTDGGLPTCGCCNKEEVKLRHVNGGQVFQTTEKGVI